MIVKLTWISFEFSLKLGWYNINNLKNICFLTNKSLLNSSYACSAIKSLSRPEWQDLDLMQVGVNRCTVPSSESLLHNLAFWAHCTWKLLRAGHSVLSEIHCPRREHRHHVGWSHDEIKTSAEQKVTLIKP